jgi:hypothetical protein
MKAIRYVIQNNNGEFYWKGDITSLYGFDKNFDKAFLFKSKLAAELRMRIFPNCTIKEVELKLIEK